MVQNLSHAVLDIKRPIDDIDIALSWTLITSQTQVHIVTNPSLVSSPFHGSCSRSKLPFANRCDSFSANFSLPRVYTRKAHRMAAS